MEREIEIHAYHGWGFDSSFWNPFKEVLPSEIILKRADRGYFGGEFFPEFDTKSKVKVLFLHSYGLHWCPDPELEQADFIIVMNGFNTFHPLEWRKKNHSKKVLNMMLKQFKASSRAVLTQFRKNCFYPEATEIELNNWMNTSRLYSDLKALHKVKFKLPKLDKAKWIVIDSVKDKIVAGKRGQELLVREDFSYKSFDNAGHGFPFLNSEDCWSYLCDVMPIFEAYASHTK